MTTAEAGAVGEVEAAPREMEMTPAQALRFAVHLQQNGRVPEAVEMLRDLESALVDDVENYPPLLHFRGVAEHQSGRPAEAVALIERSLALVSDNAGWWLNYAVALRAASRLDDAVDAYARADQLAPGQPAIYNNLGLLQRARHNVALAEACFRRAIELNADFGVAWNNLADLLVHTGRASEGCEAGFRAMTLMPHDKEARRLVGYAYGQLGETEKAREIYQEWLEQEPDSPVARHHLAALDAQPPARASDAYVVTVFDLFAATFDEKLKSLEYHAPELANARLLARLAPGEIFTHVLDAGCGTGLCGPGLRPHARRLTGVDLSGAMLAKARELKLYDHLVRDELTAYLTAHPAAFDALISADTLCYFGDLGPPLSAALAALTPGGSLVFTVEALPDDDAQAFRLAHNGRYAHRLADIRALMGRLGWTDLQSERVTLRMEAAKPVAGHLIGAVAPR